MSKICAIPGCPSEVEKTTLFSITSTPALTKWWQNCPWNGNRYMADNKEGVVSSRPKVQICVAHFRPNELDRSKSILRIAATAVPTINLPQNLKTEFPIDTGTGNPVLLYCRFCARKQHQPIENHLENLVESEDLLQLCLGRGRFLEGFPSGVCDPCLKIIRVSSSFIRNCEKAQEKLQKMFFGTAQQQADSFQEEEDEDAQSFTMPEAIVSLDEYEEPRLNIAKSDLEDPLGDDDDDDDDYDDYKVNSDNVNLMHNLLALPGSIKSELMQPVGKATSSGEGSSANSEGEIKCQECNRTFNRKRALKAHMESLHEGRVFTCKICGKSMGWRKTLQRHMKSHEENYYKHKCEICDKSFSRPSHLKLHMTKHTGVKVRCPLCSSGCRCNYKLVEHIVKIHHMDHETAKMYAQQAEVY
ncbi:transcription factor Ouib-like [Uranotaenia lowii]|uniref:transcription factor Ouib-like n=1 Tax=Uranotaenia lowii TaxID=190385 RepID=UPI00247A942D|nr:transcription factor Ouib-like [Uranotaenia lowii]